MSLSAAPVPFQLHLPSGEPCPVVFDSPHSGQCWPPDFEAAAPRDAILSTWDAFVDELWAHVPVAGAVLIAATFPRAYIDANRTENDIDPALLREPWPEPLLITEYTSRGMGLIRRHALPGVPMYDRLLDADEVRHRIESCYRPYRAALRTTLDGLWQRHGGVWHVNCHSMKSRGNAMNRDNGAPRPDFVVSDYFGTTANSGFTAWAAQFFLELGHSVNINEPYRGGDIVRAHGSPLENRQSIQIEINRALYMDESSFEKTAGFERLKTHLDAFVAALVDKARRETGCGNLR